MSIDLDVKYLGQRLPGNGRERLILLQDLEEFLQDNGEQWVRESAGRLLSEAQFIVDEKIL